MKRKRGQGTSISGALVAAVVVACLTVGFGRSALADPTVDFEQLPAGTVLTSQYADLGGVGQGVVFGPLPAGAQGEGLRPVVRTPPAGQAQSGSNVADIATCVGCEFFTPRTTGTFAVPRSRVSVHVGYLGEPTRCTERVVNSAGCAVVTLRAFDRDGKQVAESSVRVTRGAGVHARLSVATPSAAIVGFELSGRRSIDDGKAVAIDDLSFGPLAASAAPDFTLNPAVTNVIVVQGSSATVAIGIGRLNGSTGGIAFRATGLPAGVTAMFAPNPLSGSQTMLGLTAAANAPAARRTISVSGAPQSASAGAVPRHFTLDLTVQRTCKHVSTRETLITAVGAGFKCIFVENDAAIDLTPQGTEGSEGPAVLAIPAGVTLMSGRSPTVRGGLLYMSRRLPEKSIMLDLGPDTRITGLRLRGYQPTDTKDRDDPTKGILVNGAGARIENNEIFGWPGAAVAIHDTPADVRDTPVDLNGVPRITGNFIHHNVQCNKGYGVVTGVGAGPGFALIDHNVFDFNRHDIASAGGPGPGYVAELNLVLTSGPKCGGNYNQHFDQHGKGKNGGYDGGTAGTLIEIRRNTIRGAQTYGFRGRLTRPAFELRGTPDKWAIFADNVVTHKYALKQRRVFGKTVRSKGAVRIEGASSLFLAAQKKLVIRGNKMCVDTAHELAVGDFNGDRRVDVFQAVGTLWVYSPSGSREWFILNDSTVRLDQLGLGDFDGDGKTDVFWQDRGRWLVSPGGTGAPTALAALSGIAVKQLRFGDFDGDRKTDVFRASGSRFFFSSAAATAWRPLAVSRLKIGELRFGDFDGDGKMDVFSLANSQWSVSYGGSTAWQRLNSKLSSNLGSLVFADFNGDRKTDVARTGGGKWQVSWGGATGWQTLQLRRSEPLSTGMLFGDFDGDGRADVLQHGAKKSLPSPGCGLALKNFVSFERFRLSSGGAHPLANWSSADMR